MCSLESLDMVKKTFEGNYEKFHSSIFGMKVGSFWRN